MSLTPLGRWAVRAVLERKREVIPAIDDVSALSAATILRVWSQIDDDSRDRVFLEWHPDLTSISKATDILMALSNAGTAPERLAALDLLDRIGVAAELPAQLHVQRQGRYSGHLRRWLADRGIPGPDGVVEEGLVERDVLLDELTASLAHGPAAFLETFESVGGDGESIELVRFLGDSRLPEAEDVLRALAELHRSAAVRRAAAKALVRRQTSAVAEDQRGPAS